MSSDQPISADANEPTEEVEALDLAGKVNSPTVAGLPRGYVYGVSRYADVILDQAFPERFTELKQSLETFRPTIDELRAGGGGRTVFVARFDQSLAEQRDAGQKVWDKANITIEKGIGFDGTTETVSRVRGHEIDMFGFGSLEWPLPGIAVEMEWNNKDPFFDRDLGNFQALHQEGAIAVGVIVTRGPQLQELISGVIRSKDAGFKYGGSTTHWEKLVPRVNLGGGGECPLFLVGIEPGRIEGIDLAYQVRAKLDEAEDLRANWRNDYDTFAEAKPKIATLRAEAFDLMPPLSDVTVRDDE